MLITAEFAGVLAGDLSRPNTDEEHVKDAWEGDYEAWAWAQCVIENRSIIYCKPFDSTLAATVEWSFTDENDRDHFLTVTAEAWYKDLSNDNLYTISTSSTLNMYVSSGGGGGEPCPTLFVWNGTGYVDYGVINIHDPLGEDVIQEVPVLAVDVEINKHKATFRLREGWPGLEFSESDIDQVKLYAVDSNGQYYLCPLIKAKHSQQGSVLLKLLLSDDYKVKITLLETIDLTFIVPYPNVQGFTFVIEGNNMLKP